MGKYEKHKAGPKKTPEPPANVQEAVSQRTPSLYGGNSSLNELFDEFTKLKKGDETALEDNPLDKYIDVTYGVSISLVDSGPGNASTFEQLSGYETTTFASSGAVNDTVNQLYGITGLDVKTVMSVNAANPEFARSIEIKAELLEPHGLSFDRNIRAAAAKMSYAQANPAFYIWRIDMWWSGYDPTNGKWVNRIPFGGFRGEKIDTVTHFCHLITLEASVKSDGTIYQLTFVPVSFTATRPEMMIIDSIELVIEPLSEAKLGRALDDLQATLTKRAKDKLVNHTYVIKYPDAFKDIDIFDNESKEWQLTANKVILSAPARTAISAFIMNIISASPEIRSYAADSVLATGRSGVPNMSFTIYTDVDYSTAIHNQKSNSYEGITFTFEIVPYFEWKSKLPKNGEIESSADYALRNLRRVYNYAWTSTNTEVLEYNATIKLFYFINEGYGGLLSQGFADSVSSNVEERTPQRADQQYDDASRQYQKRPRPEWNGSDPGSGPPLGNPVQGSKVISVWGDPRDGGRRRHKGNDLAAPSGTPIRTVRGGRVTRNEYQSGYGWMIEIDHGGGWRTRHAHMREKSPLRIGDRVDTGDQVGTVGKTGNARNTTPHDHYEMFYDKNGDGRVTQDEAVPPDSYVRGDPSGQLERPDPFNPSQQSRTPGADGGPSSERDSPTRGDFGANGNPSLGRNVPFTFASNVIGTGPVGAAAADATIAFENYQLAFERRIGPDMVKLEGMKVKGDPRWMIGYDQLKTFNITSSLIRVNVFQPDQAEYMSSSRAKRESDLSLGGWYELISIDHSFKGGVFTQTLTGYRLIGLNLT